MHFFSVGKAFFFCVLVFGINEYLDKTSLPVLCPHIHTTLQEPGFKD